MPKIIIASGPVIIEKNGVLLVKEGSSDFWKFPGGKVEESDKTLIATAKREVEEEVRIGIEILDKNPFLFYAKKQAPSDDFDFILVHFLAKRIGEISPSKDIREWKWIPLEELDDEYLAPNILPTLKHFGFIKAA